MTPYFELHIRPMFRLIDRDHMTFAFDLFDYDAVVEHKDDIAALLAESMPPKSTGGLWPEEWVALFNRWVEAGCPRLELPQGVKYSITTTGGRFTLVGEGQSPDSGDVWFDRRNESESPREYTLYHRPGEAGAKPFRAQERLPSGTASVVVHDGDGAHTVNA